ncbi:MAG TPA: hypothetical protein PLG25_00595 [bacterium]|nr:hypothetical protein [bacterium]
MTLEALLEDERSEIIEEAVAAMERTHLSHYRQAGVEVSRQRLEDLYDLIAGAAHSKNLTRLTDHIEIIAGERFQSGYDLHETQTAINVLEEALWQRVIGKINPAILGHALGVISTILGAAKDRLGQTYVALASNRRAPSLNLQALFVGSEGNPVSHN